MNAIDRIFAGAIPQTYEAFLVPLIFAPYADPLARRVAARPVARVLEIAAGTGVVTRALAERLPASAAIVATDLNPSMIDHAASIGTRRRVEWRQADAMALPFDDETFDAVVCQFGAMFFPDKPRAFAEARRVLKPRGAFTFNVWDRIEENDFADVVTRSLEALFPHDPPRFLARTPHGYFDPAAIACDLAQAGFVDDPDIDIVAERSVADSPRIPAIAYCEGTPMRNEIERAATPSRLAEATDVAAHAVAARFGGGRVDGKVQALVVTVAK